METMMEPIGIIIMMGALVYAWEHLGRRKMLPPRIVLGGTLMLFIAGLAILRITFLR